MPSSAKKTKLKTTTITKSIPFPLAVYKVQFEWPIIIFRTFVKCSHAVS